MGDSALLLSYGDRDEALETLGFANYGAYLESDLWKAIRARVLKRHGHRCCLCHDPTRIVHHNSYDVDTLRGMKISELYALCERCHRKIEFSDGGQKRPMRHVRKVLLALLSQHERRPKHSEKHNRFSRKLAKKHRRMEALREVQAAAIRSEEKAADNLRTRSEHPEESLPTFELRLMARLAMKAAGVDTLAELFALHLGGRSSRSAACQE